jgi:hypothetical protein
MSRGHETARLGSNRVMYMTASHKSADYAK